MESGARLWQVNMVLLEVEMDTFVVSVVRMVSGRRYMIVLLVIVVLRVDGR